MALAQTSEITLAGANQAVAAGLAEAKKQGWKVVVCVCDAGGIPIAMQRLDGTMPASWKIAAGKAETAVLFARETKLLEGAVNGAKSNGNDRNALLSAGYILMEGGIPIYCPTTGKIVGGVGVSGVKPNEDAAVAAAAVKAFNAAVGAPASKL
eukprot:CAMPEP_0206472528 /NCGR_PEP_ID=MMETSP0324_2-20121206/32256_1 /ASSEMBLY_ACC=CAM_ASM_000836 /TAXON_ID=2866 /ORGANISM="Crypthecodinium cohnii, Strain Seligo" /LENGTH=152 /DNA_ID=CAMNT_0053947149 /DNA_START=82 /DNA_END=540 /DNA_ORIENTATION=-